MFIVVNIIVVVYCCKYIFGDSETLGRALITSEISIPQCPHYFTIMKNKNRKKFFH